MRILFTSYPMHGHVKPMLALALAARAAGHRVAFATGPDMVAELERHGLEAWTCGAAHAEVAAVEPPSERWFVISAERRADELVPRATAWRPDLVISDEFELAGPVAARATGAQFVVHGLGVMTPMPIFAGVEAAIEELHLRWGLRDGVAGVRSAAYLEAMPPSLRPPGERVWSDVRPLRPTPGLAAPGDSLPAAVDGLPHAETIHLTLGTLFHEMPGVLHTAIDGLRELPLNLVVTCGPGVDPARFGPQPEHVLIEPYIPHALLLPRCRLVVSQGGAGIMFGALAHDLPQLMLPQGADQFINADACTRAGAALALSSDGLTAASVADAARRLLSEPGYRESAAALGMELRAMPWPHRVLDALVASVEGPSRPVPLNSA